MREGCEGGCSHTGAGRLGEGSQGGLPIGGGCGDGCVEWDVLLLEGGRWEGEGGWQKICAG